MDEGRLKIDGSSLLTSIIINVIVFSLAFVYLSGGVPAVENPQVEIPIPVDSEISPVPEMTFNPDPVAIIPPADFIDESGSSSAGGKYDNPKFKQIFDSYLLQGDVKGKEFIVTLRLQIDARGQLAAEPRVMVSSGNQAVDAETIRRLQRVSFTPAKNSTTGEAVASVVTTKIFWLPGGG